MTNWPGPPGKPVFWPLIFAAVGFAAMVAGFGVLLGWSPEPNLVALVAFMGVSIACGLALEREIKK